MRLLRSCFYCLTCCLPASSRLLRRPRWCIALILAAFCVIFIAQFLQANSLLQNDDSIINNVDYNVVPSLINNNTVNQQQQQLEDNLPHQVPVVNQQPFHNNNNNNNFLIPMQQQLPRGVKLPKSDNNNVAILVIDDGTGNSAAVDFINSARTHFQLTSIIPITTTIPPSTTTTTTTAGIRNNNISTQVAFTTPATMTLKKNVTFFLFTGQTNNNAINANDVIVVKTDGDIFKKSNRNPCHVYAQYSEKSGYFDVARFDHVLSFDGKMRVLSPINLHDEMLGELTAVTHPAFFNFAGRYTSLLPYDRRNGSCVFVPPGNEAPQTGYFAGNLFGGETSEVAKMCQELAKKCNDNNDENPPEFHQMINYYFRRRKPPTRTLTPSFCYPMGMSELPFYPQKVQLQERLPDDPYLMTRDMGDELFFARREKRIQKIADEIKQNYMLKTASKFSHALDVRRFRHQFVVYYCGSGSNCGKLGDRFRGAVSLLFLAIASERIYSLQWTDPIDVGEHFFAVNEKWYNITAVQFQSELLQSSYKPRYIEGVSYEAHKLTALFNTWRLQELRQKVDVAFITTNLGKTLMEPLFRVPSFYPAIHTAIPTQLPEFKVNMNYGIYLSAAMRLIFGQLTDSFQNLLKKAAEDEPNWDKALKIGVQIKTCRNRCSPVMSNDRWKCFAGKAHDIYANNDTWPTKKGAVIVVVTSDLEGDDRRQVVDTVRQVFAGSGEEVKVVDKQVDLMLKSNDSQKNKNWRETASALIDWYLLTKMDWLVITNGGFGETASLYSMKPTYRIVENDPACRFTWYNADISKTDRF